MTRLIFLIIFYLFSLNLLCQKAFSPYSSDYFLPDENSFYTSGRKRIHFEKSFSEDGYFHNFNFYISKFNLNGEKEWEVVIDKKRNCRSAGQIFKKGNFFYTNFIEENSKPETSIFYFTHFLIKFDSLGKVIQEKKLNDSTFYSSNTIFYADDFIYVVLIKDRVVCEKYDYNFNLLEIIDDDLTAGFFYNSKIFQTVKNYICVGPLDDIKSVNGKISDKTLNPFRYQNFCVKKIARNFSKESIIAIEPIPTDELVDFITFDNGLMYIGTKGLNKNNKKHKLYTYEEVENKLLLITDTLSQATDFFAVTQSKGFLLKTAKVSKLIETGIWKNIPQSLYYLKNGKIATRTLIEDQTVGEFAMRYQVFGKNLFMYQIDNNENKMKIKIYDYEKGVFKESR